MLDLTSLVLPSAQNSHIAAMPGSVLRVTNCKRLLPPIRLGRLADFSLAGVSFFLPRRGHRSFALALRGEVESELRRLVSFPQFIGSGSVPG